MLAEAGCAGKPASYFYRPSLEDWMDRLGVRRNAETEKEILALVFQAAIRQGRASTEVFGLRQQRPSFGFLCDKLQILHPDAASDRERIERVFGRTLFIHLSRADKLAQAVSCVKAQQSGLWHVAADGSEFERLAPHKEPAYDAAQIGRWIETMTAYDAGWTAWFEREDIQPLNISYDDLAQSPVDILRRVLEALGLDGNAADGVKPGVRKMADAASREWMMRYRARR